MNHRVIIACYDLKTKNILRKSLNENKKSSEKFKEKTLETKVQLAEKRLSNKNQSNVPGQITQNNTYIFNPKEQFKVMKELNLPLEKVEQPNFDLS